jgi:hypothetical protein
MSTYSLSPLAPTSQASPSPRLRAIVEIVGNELVICPIANSDSDEKIILDALRFVIADGVAR